MLILSFSFLYSIKNKKRLKRGDKYGRSYERKFLLDSAISLLICIGHLI